MNQVSQKLDGEVFLRMRFDIAHHRVNIFTAVVRCHVPNRKYIKNNYCKEIAFKCRGDLTFNIRYGMLIKG